MCSLSKNDLEVKSLNIAGRLNQQVLQCRNLVRRRPYYRYHSSVFDTHFECEDENKKLRSLSWATNYEDQSYPSKLPRYLANRASPKCIEDFIPPHRIGRVRLYYNYHSSFFRSTYYRGRWKRNFRSLHYKNITPPVPNLLPSEIYDEPYENSADSNSSWISYNEILKMRPSNKVRNHRMKRRFDREAKCSTPVKQINSSRQQAILPIEYKPIDRDPSRIVKISKKARRCPYRRIYSVYGQRSRWYNYEKLEKIRRRRYEEQMRKMASKNVVGWNGKRMVLVQMEISDESSRKIAKYDCENSISVEMELLEEKIRRLHDKELKWNRRQRALDQMEMMEEQRIKLGENGRKRKVSDQRGNEKRMKFYDGSENCDRKQIVSERQEPMNEKRMKFDHRSEKRGQKRKVSDRLEAIDEKRMKFAYTKQKCDRKRKVPDRLGTMDEKRMRLEPKKRITKSSHKNQKPIVIYV